MPPYHQRFHTTGAVRRVMQAGQTRRGRSMMIKVARSKYPAGRMAVIVSKKVYKSAVKRNRIRRRIYNIVRHEISRLSMDSMDIVITVFSPDVLTVQTAHLQRELTSLIYSSLKRDPAV